MNYDLMMNVDSEGVEKTADYISNYINNKRNQKRIYNHIAIICIYGYNESRIKKNWKCKAWKSHPPLQMRMINMIE